MSITTTADFDAQVALGQVSPVFLAELELLSSTLYLSTHRNDLSWNSQTWLGNGWISQVRPASEQSDTRTNGASITLAGVPSGVVSLALNSVRRNKFGKFYIGFVRALESRENLLTYSEQFENWSHTRSSNSSNKAINPVSGAHTADELIEDSSAGLSHYMVQSVTLTQDIQYKYGVRVRRSTGTRDIQLQLAGAAVDFHMDTTSVGDASGNDDAGIEALGGGWFYVWLTVTPASTGSTSAYIGLITTGGTQNYNGDGSSSLYIFGAHLHEVDGRPSGYLATAATAQPQEGFGLTVVEDPILLFWGLFDQCGIREASGRSDVTLSYESQAIAADIVQNHRWTHESQQSFFLGDKGFEGVAAAVNWRGVWGKPESAG